MLKGGVLTGNSVAPIGGSQGLKAKWAIRPEECSENTGVVHVYLGNLGLKIQKDVETWVGVRPAVGLE